jgi:hypothetical protein
MGPDVEYFSYQTTLPFFVNQAGATLNMETYSVADQQGQIVDFGFNVVNYGTWNLGNDNTDGRVDFARIQVKPLGAIPAPHFLLAGTINVNTQAMIFGGVTRFVGNVTGTGNGLLYFYGGGSGSLGSEDWGYITTDADRSIAGITVGFGADNYLTSTNGATWVFDELILRNGEQKANIIAKRVTFPDEDGTSSQIGWLSGTLTVTENLLFTRSRTLQFSHVREKDQQYIPRLQLTSIFLPSTALPVEGCRKAHFGSRSRSSH